MLNVYFTFEGPTGNVRSCFGNTEKAIEDLMVTRTAVGAYTCVFLTGHHIDRNQLPIINVASSGPTGTAGVCNVVTTNFFFIPEAPVFNYRITFDIETYGGTSEPAIMMVSYTQ